ncbi:MAG: radical SAM protein [Treponema sp.]|nr:radical SAM protein [Treponema sp.]
MNIGLLSVDGHHFPNLALGKIARWHRLRGDSVEWVTPLFGDYDRIYASKIFNFSPDIPEAYDCEIIRGGTGYDIHSRLPEEIDLLQPDYSIYQGLHRLTSIGFLTRGCPNRCSWCVVPQKEGDIHPYMDIDQIVIENRTNVILMDNNILASDYGLSQIEKIAERRLRVDFNQGLDARLVTPEIARLLARVRWQKYIRFACDTHAAIKSVHKAIRLIRQHNPKAYFHLYCLLNGSYSECLDRLRYWRDTRDRRLILFAQPYRDPHNRNEIPDWQKDMAQWVNRREYFRTCTFEDFQPRKNFRCAQYNNTQTPET